MTNNNPIGVYDSGVGGLTVLSELVKLLPNEEYMYFGDLKNLPYGEKTKEELLVIGRKIFDFFKEKNVKAVVMACNTTSALLYDKIKDNYDFKIYPVIQTVAKYLSEQKVNKIGVFATQATINSHAYKNEIQKYNKNIEVFEQACPKWVKIVEDKDFSKENLEIIEDDLQKMLLNNPEKIVLGCTHYPYLQDVLLKNTDKNVFINPAKHFARLIVDDLKKNGLISDKKNQKQEFFVSKEPKQFKNSAKMFFEIKNEPEIIDLK